jgi:hypothetical protein
MAADLTIPTLRVLCPNTDFYDPNQCTMRINRCPNNPIKGLVGYLTEDLFELIAKMYALRVQPDSSHQTKL